MLLLISTKPFRNSYCNIFNFVEWAQAMRYDETVDMQTDKQSI